MISVLVPSVDTYVNLNTLASISASKSFVITNHSSNLIYVIVSSTQPLDTDRGIPLYSTHTFYVEESDTTIWIKGGPGPVVIQDTSEIVAPYSTTDLPKDVWTSDQEGFRRLRVDIGQTGFFLGKEFRVFREFSIASGTTLVLRITVPINAILFEQGVEIDAGSLRITNALGGTPGGSFSEVITPIGKNNMSTRPTPFYTPQITWAAGGTHTGGFVFDIHRAVAANATAQQTTVGNIVGDERGVAVGTYYVRYENFGAGTATGTLWFFYEERN